LELISEISKIISFAFRLLGNLFAGMVFLFVMAFLLPIANMAFFWPGIFCGVDSSGRIWSAHAYLHG
jgi:F-type H+-transporting ATPase subunit a